MPQIKVEGENGTSTNRPRHPSMLEEPDGYLSDSSSSSSDEDEEEDGDGDAETEEVESPGGINLHLPPNKYLCESQLMYCSKALLLSFSLDNSAIVFSFVTLATSYLWLLALHRPTHVVELKLN